MREIAKDYISYGLNPVPLKKGGKIPIRPDWGSPINKEVDDYDFGEIGICTGAVSGGLEGIDFDLKYSDDPKKLWDEWRNRVPLDILKKLTVCSTVSGGYHALYRTSIMEGNKKLAKNKSGEVLIETRGEGGYLKCYPSKGYEVIYGSLDDIKTLSDTERAILMSTSLLFDETISKTKKFYSDKKEYKDPFPEYNNDPDIGIDLLVDHGWSIERESENWVELTRPGKSEGVSAGYNLEGNFLYVFTTSTDFETEKPYSNSAIYCVLECEGDFKEGYKKLKGLGHGESEDEEEEELDLSFISKSGEDEERLNQAIDGTIPLGLSYGWPTLDEYVLFKENSLNFILAFEGVGKTYVELHKFVALSVLYGKRFAVCCGENETYSIKRILIEALSGKDISYFKDNKEEYSKHKEFIDNHFFIFKNDTHYTVEDVLKRGEYLHKEYKIDGLFIDPFSYFKRPLNNVYSYNDDLLSRLNIFSKTVCSVFMSVHPTTDATRAPRDSEGYLRPPNQYDAIGGNIFANRSDHFLVYHRIRNHKIPSMRRIMEIRQYKVKDEATGGKVTPINESVTLTLKEVDGFTGYFDKEGNNPMKKRLMEGSNKELPKMEPSVDIF